MTRWSRASRRPSAARPSPAPRSSCRVGSVKAAATADGKGRYAWRRPARRPREAAFTATDKAGNTVSHTLSVTWTRRRRVSVVTEPRADAPHGAARGHVRPPTSRRLPGSTATLDGDVLRSPQSAASTKVKLGPPGPGQAHAAGDRHRHGPATSLPKQTFTRRQHGALRRGPCGRRQRQGREDAAEASFGTPACSRGKPNGVYDLTTTPPSSASRRSTAMTVDGMVGGNMLTRLERPIVVDLGDAAGSTCTSTASSSRVYPVAVGQPAYPTPTGTYVIVQDQGPDLVSRPTRTGPRTPSPSRRARATRSARAGSAPARRASASTARPTTPPSAPTPRTAASACTSGTSRTLYDVGRRRHAGDHPPVARPVRSGRRARRANVHRGDDGRSQALQRRSLRAARSRWTTWSRRPTTCVSPAQAAELRRAQPLQRRARRPSRPAGRRPDSRYAARRETVRAVARRRRARARRGARALPRGSDLSRTRRLRAHAARLHRPPAPRGPRATAWCCRTRRRTPAPRPTG